MTARHITICFHDFARGGTERVALTLARHWLDAGREVSILCGSKGGGVLDQVDPRVRVVELDPPVPRSLTSRLRLGRAMAGPLAGLAPDVVFIPGNFHFVLPPAFKRTLPGLPIVAKVSNPLLPRLAPGIAALARAALRAYVAPIDALVFMADELAAEGRGALPGRRIEVIAEPNLPAGWKPLPRTAPQDPPRIITIGRMEPQKNLALALRAFAELRKIRPARLLVLGEGSERARLEALARDLGIAGDVEMPGYSPRAGEELARASALLLTSRYEGYPAVVVEALAADVPVVATDCTPVLAGLLPDARHGRIVAEPEPKVLAAALAQVLDGPFASGGARPARVAHHDASASAAAYLALFDSLV